MINWLLEAVIAVTDIYVFVFKEINIDCKDRGAAWWSFQTQSKRSHIKTPWLSSSEVNTNPRVMAPAIPREGKGWQACHQGSTCFVLSNAERLQRMRCVDSLWRREDRCVWAHGTMKALVCETAGRNTSHKWVYTKHTLCLQLWELEILPHMGRKARFLSNCEESLLQASFWASLLWWQS